MRGSVAALLGACLCVAFATLATKPVLGEAPALPVVLVQVATSLAAIGGVAVLQGRWPRIRRDWRLALPGLLQPGLSYGLMFAGLALIPASVAGLLFATEAALVALAAWPLLGERPSRTTIGSILASTLGVALLAGAGTGAPMVSITGVALVLAGIICAAMDTVAARALAVTADPLTMAVATHLGALIMIVASLCFFPPVDWRWLADSQALRRHLVPPAADSRQPSKGVTLFSRKRRKRTDHDALDQVEPRQVVSQVVRREELEAETVATNEPPRVER